MAMTVLSAARVWTKDAGRTIKIFTKDIPGTSSALRICECFGATGINQKLNNGIPIWLPICKWGILLPDNFNGRLTRQTFTWNTINTNTKIFSAQRAGFFLQELNHLAVDDGPEVGCHQACASHNPHPRRVENILLLLFASLLPPYRIEMLPATASPYCLANTPRICACIYCACSLLAVLLLVPMFRWIIGDPQTSQLFGGKTKRLSFSCVSTNCSRCPSRMASGSQQKIGFSPYSRQPVDLAASIAFAFVGKNAPALTMSQHQCNRHRCFAAFLRSLHRLSAPAFYHNSFLPRQMHFCRPICFSRDKIKAGTPTRPAGSPRQGMGTSVHSWGIRLLRVRFIFSLPQQFVLRNDQLF